MTTTRWTRTFASPVGALTAVTDGHALTALAFDALADAGDGPAPSEAAALLDRVERQLD